jgi:hypothetical protein
VNNPVTDTANNFRACFAYGEVTGSGVATITPTWSAAPGAADYAWIEISGVDLADAFEASDLTFGSNLGTGANGYDPASEITPANNGAFIWQAGGDMNENNALTNGAGWTADITTGAPSETGYKIQGTAGVQAAQFTSSNAFLKALIGIIAFNAAAGGGGRTTKNSRSFPLGMHIGMNIRGNV